MGDRAGGQGWGRQPGPAAGLGLSGLFVQIWKVFLSPFESRRPWPKRSAFQILQAGRTVPALPGPPPPASPSSACGSSQHPPTCWGPAPSSSREPSNLLCCSPAPRQGNTDSLFLTLASSYSPRAPHIQLSHSVFTEQLLWASSWARRVDCESSGLPMPKLKFTLPTPLPCGMAPPPPGSTES